MIQKGIVQLISSITILGLVVFSGAINAQGVKNVKQYYSDSDVGISVHTTEIMDGYKFLFIDLSGKTGNFFYDEYLIDEQLPNNAVRKNHSVVIKTDMDNNYKDHFKYSGYNYHSVAHGDEIIFFPVLDTSIVDWYEQHNIIGLDKNLNVIYKENIKGGGFIKLEYWDNFLFIHASNWLSRPIIIGEDSMQTNNVATHCTMKRDYKNKKNIWEVIAARESHARDEEINVSSTGEVYISGGFGSSTSGAIAIGMDTLFTPNYDGFIYKIDRNGRLFYMKQVYGDGIESISNLIIDDSDNIFINITSSGQSAEMTYDGIAYPLANPFSGYRSSYIMRLDDEGHVIWAKSVGGQWVLFQNIIFMDDNTLLLCLNYTALKIDEIEESSGSSFVSLNKNTGYVKNHYKLETNAIMNMKFGSKNVAASIISCPISLYKEDSDVITFVGKEYYSYNNVSNSASIYCDINFDELSNVEQNLEQEKLLIYPNPLFSYSLLQISSEISVHRAQLYDINGKVVLEKKEDNIREISLEGTQTIVSGVYFLKLYTENQVITKKIIIH